MPAGALVLSFDFELAWGMRGRLRGSQRFGRVTREVVPRLLEILARHEISATWATVGHLMVRETDCSDGRYVYPLLADNPAPRLDSDEAENYYAPEAIAAILECSAPQELAAHSFSHQLFDDRRCDAETARIEYAECQQIASRWDRQLVSFVFPRNMVGHLNEMRAAGFRCYRAPNAEWYWFGRPTTIYARRWLRMPVWVLRYLDERLAFRPPLPPARRVAGLWEIPHSMFFPGLRGVSQWIRPELRVRRAAKGLERAAERGRIFSMFAHPHNFLPEPKSLLAAFEQICRHAAELREAGKLQILTMSEAATQLENGQGEHWR